MTGRRGRTGTGHRCRLEESGIAFLQAMATIAHIGVLAAER